MNHALRNTHTQNRFLLLVGVALLALIISLGTLYVQRTPALSSNALFASAEEAFLGFQLRNIQSQPTEKMAQSIPALTYHRIVSDSSDVSNVTKSRFKDQMVSLKKAGWETVSLQEFEEFMRGERQVPEKSFLLTFDDGAKESFYPVDPILAALGYEATNFIIVASSETLNSTYYLNPYEIERMLKSGRWSIGSHSYDGHRPYPVDASGTTGIFFADRIWNSTLNRLETEAEFDLRVEKDLRDSQKALSEKYSVPINSFAFPLGNETGINGANNFPEGSQDTEALARRIYEFGHVQTDNQQFTSNIPFTRAASEQFRIYRIHVDYDWDGARIVSLLENSREKTLPFEDDFSQNHGWIPSWGNVELGRNNFVLRANADGTSASAFLDGTQLWDRYSFDAAFNWTSGHMLILADVVNASTYHACVFSPGVVHIQETKNGVTTTLAERKDSRIGYGSGSAGVRVHDSVIECRWNFASIAETYNRSFTGGAGIQAWNEQNGAASLTISSVIARPYDGSTPD
jgi:peptidoglycan/xylan/chitin deacetylase (PgdA/CDA1 family)